MNTHQEKRDHIATIVLCHRETLRRHSSAAGSMARAAIEIIGQDSNEINFARLEAILYGIEACSNSVYDVVRRAVGEFDEDQGLA